MNDELYHHGIKGQKWGVRRYQNKDGSLTPAGRERIDKEIKKVNSLYDHIDKMVDKKITKFEAKGETAKTNVMKYMRDENKRARKDKITALKNMNYTDLKKAKKQDSRDLWSNTLSYMDNNAAMMTTPSTRFGEYQTQSGMVWATNFVQNSTLARMTVKQGYEYLKRMEASGRNRSIRY